VIKIVRDWISSWMSLRPSLSCRYTFELWCREWWIITIRGVIRTFSDDEWDWSVITWWRFNSNACVRQLRCWWEVSRCLTRSVIARRPCWNDCVWPELLRSLGGMGDVMGSGGSILDIKAQIMAARMAARHQTITNFPPREQTKNRCQILNRNYYYHQAT
jgi:hypothetical protein